MAEEGTQASEGVLSPEEMMEEDDDDEYVTLNMHQIVENLWIGDFLSSQQYPIRTSRDLIWTALACL